MMENVESVAQCMHENPKNYHEPKPFSEILFCLLCIIYDIQMENSLSGVAIIWKEKKRKKKWPKNVEINNKRETESNEANETKPNQSIIGVCL